MARKKPASNLSAGEQFAGAVFFIIYALILPVAMGPLFRLAGHLLGRRIHADTQAAIYYYGLFAVTAVIFHSFLARTTRRLLEDLSGRSGCEEIAQFAQIFALAKRNGGNMAEIIQSSAVQIGKQIELRQEIRTLLGGKQMELGIMKIMPFGILLYINMGNPGYFDSLYHNLTGILIMTGCLGVYLGAYFLGERIMKGIMAEMS